MGLDAVSSRQDRTDPAGLLGGFAAGAVGNVVGLILLGALVVGVFVAAVFAVVAAFLTVVGTAAVTVGSAIAHIFSRLR